MKRIITSLFALFLVLGVNAQEQTLEELKAMYDAKSGEAAALKAEADALKGKIDAFPGWKIGGLGVLGFNLFDNNSWYAIDQPYSSQNSSNLGFTAFANFDAAKTFMRNTLTINMTKTNSKENDDASTVESISDRLGINALGGYKLTDKIALSAEANYNTTVLNFNDPGQLTISAGATWLPIKDLVVIIHPLGYQFNFPSSSFTSVAGAKIGATYTRELIPGLKWNTSLNSFISYGKGDNTFGRDAMDEQITIVDGFSIGDMSNWIWENGIAFTAWKGIGVGINAGLAKNKQLVEKYRFSNADDPSIDTVNPFQTFWNAGLSYGF